MNGYRNGGRQFHGQRNGSGVPLGRQTMMSFVELDPVRTSRFGAKLGDVWKKSGKKAGTFRLLQ